MQSVPGGYAMVGSTQKVLGALVLAGALAAYGTPARAQQPPAARAPVGYLVVAGLVNGPAAVTVDGRPHGNVTIEELTLELAPGPHELVVAKPGFSGCRRAVTVVANDLVRVVCTLGPAAARIVSDTAQNSTGAQLTRTLRIIHLSPSTVPVKVGANRGMTPATVLLPVGDNTILLNGKRICLRVPAPSTDADTAALRLVVRAGTTLLASGFRMCGPAPLASPDERAPIAQGPKSLAAEARRAAAPPAVPAAVPPAAAPAAAAAPPRPAFIVIDMDEAATRLAGTVRYFDGLSMESVKVGPGALVPGADAAREVVRVTYSDPQGRRIQLDQQQLPTPRDTSRAARQRAVPASLGLAWGDTLATAGPDGESRLRWLDRDGLWLSLSAQMSADSLRALISRIR
jgi:hypothetical protein